MVRSGWRRSAEAASSGSIPPPARPRCWTGRGRGLGGVPPGAPWRIAPAATDVVLLDRDRQAWRFDLVEQVAHPLGLPGLAAASGQSRLLAALPHRPPRARPHTYVA